MKSWDKSIKRILTAALTFISLMGGVVIWGQVTSVFAKAEHVQNNSSLLGGLIGLQKLVIEENRREYARAKLLKLSLRLEKVEALYLLPNQMPSDVKRHYDRLKQDQTQFENRLK